MLIAPATPRSLTLITSTSEGETRTTASPVSSVIVSASDETVNERAATVSRSLGAARGSASTTRNAAVTAAPTPSVDDARSFALARIGDEQFSCLDALWEHESNWDASAENPTSGAYGIAQALPGVKMASVGDDWMSNPITQVTWGLEYIETRYGSACDAWSFWQRHNPHWY